MNQNVETCFNFCWFYRKECLYCVSIYKAADHVSSKHVSSFSLSKSRNKEVRNSTPRKITKLKLVLLWLSFFKIKNNTWLKVAAVLSLQKKKTEQGLVGHLQSSKGPCLRIQLSFRFMMKTAVLNNVGKIFASSWKKTLE